MINQFSISFLFLPPARVFVMEKICPQKTGWQKYDYFPEGVLCSFKRYLLLFLFL